MMKMTEKIKLKIVLKILKKFIKMDELIIWNATALIFGTLEGFYFDWKPRKTEIWKMDIHIFFGFFRLCVFMPLAIIVDEFVIFSLCAMLTFPFMHDGMYYLTRNVLNPDIYKKTWFDQSTTTTALVSLSAFWRVIFFCFGLGMSFVL